MSTGIVLDTTFDNASLPTAESYGTRIKALSSLVAWFQADASSVTQSGGKITEWQDIAGGAGILSNATVDRQATLTETIGGYAAAEFVNNTTPQFYPLSGVTFDLNAAHTIVAICKPTAFTAAPRVIGGETVVNPSDRVLVTAAAGANSLTLIRNSELSIVAYTPDIPTLLIASWDGASLRTEANGVAGSVVAEAGTTTAGFDLGTGSEGQDLEFPVSDLLLFTGDLLADTDAAQLVRDYALYVYGIAS